MRFRKKPIVIEAVLVTKDIPKIIDGLPAWFRDAYEARYIQFNSEWGMVIPTLEGDMEANFGDWVIQGVEGELYPCKPNIFKKTYESVDDKALAAQVATLRNAALEAERLEQDNLSLQSQLIERNNEFIIRSGELIAKNEECLSLKREAERYKWAGKILEDYMMSGTLSDDDCAALSLYRQAVEQKEV